MIFRFDDFELDSDQSELRHNGENIPLQKKVYLLLLQLLENCERMVSRDEIIDYVWDGRIISESTIDSRIKAARQAIGDNGNEQRLIKTLRGRGLRFVGDVIRVGAQQTESAPRDADNEDIGTTRPSIAIMPFENLSDDAGNDYFVDGIGEEITSALGRLSWLFVIARNSTLNYKGKAFDVADVASELHVRYVVVGNVRKSGNRIRISIQLIDGGTNAYIWSTRYDRQIEDVFDIQDEISERIVGALEPQVNLAEIRKAMAKPEQGLDAWDCVLRAMALKSEYTQEGSREAIAFLERALSIDPDYARAHGLLGWIVMWRVHQGWEVPETALARATTAVEQAVKYDPNEFWAYVAMGFIATITKDTAMLIEATRRAIEINPSSALAHSWMGAAFAIIGRGAEAFGCIAKARQLSPRDILKEEFDIHESFAHFQVGDYHNAHILAHRVAVVQPQHIFPRLIMASSLGHQNKAPEAEAELAHIKELAPDISIESVGATSVFCEEEVAERFLEGLRSAGLI